MRALSRLLFIAGILCIATYGFVTVQAHVRQQDLGLALEKEFALHRSRNFEASPLNLSEGDLLGKLAIPRLDVSVMMMEGVAEETLRVGGGHIPGTAYPGVAGNSGFAAHRDTFF